MKGSNILPTLAAIGLLVGSSSIGHGQEIISDRMGMSPIPLTGPGVLDEISNRMTAGLRSEREASATLLAGNQLRRIVIELAARGRGDDEASAVAALEAIRLSDSVGGLSRRMDRIDRSGELFGEPPRRLTEDERRRAIERLATFHRVALDELRRRPSTTPAELDETLSLVLAPIRDVIELVERRPLEDHWPLRSMVGTRDAPAGTEDRWSTGEVESTRRISSDLERLSSLPGTRTADIERLVEVGAVIRNIEDPTRRSNLLEHRAAIVEIMIESGSLEPDAVDRGLQASARRIQNRHRREVRAVIEDLDRMSDARLDPDEAVRERLKAAGDSADDLDRLRRTGDLVERLTHLQPAAARGISTRMRMLARALADDRTRAEAARRHDEITNDLDRFVPLSGEMMLLDPDDRVSELVAGRSVELVARIERGRREWVDEISAGVWNGPGRISLMCLDRFCGLLIDVNAMRSDDPDIVRRLEIFNRWGGWYVSGSMVEWTARTITPGLRLAAIAGAEGDFERLDRDLDRLERQSPPARLVTWFSSRLEGSLAGLDGGSVGALAAVALPPAIDAWGLEHRNPLARISRGFAEIAAARRRGDTDDVERLSRWVTRTCDDLLRTVSSADSLNRPTSGSDTSSSKETDA